MVIKSKLWADQSEDDDEEDWGAEIGDSTDEGERCSVDEEMLSVGSPLPKISSSSKLNSGSKLNAKAPDFIPKTRQQQIETITTAASSIAKAVDKISGQQQLISNIPAANCVSDQHEAATLSP